MYFIVAETHLSALLLLDHLQYSCNNYNSLAHVAQRAKETLEVGTLHAAADKGYDDLEKLKQCLLNGIIPHVGFKNEQEERLFVLDYPRQVYPAEVIPYNSFPGLKTRGEKKVVIRIRDDIPTQRLRLCLSEHPFGSVKWYHGPIIFSARG